jgi:hypothetical protein
MKRRLGIEGGPPRTRHATRAWAGAVTTIGKAGWAGWAPAAWGATLSPRQAAAIPRRVRRFRPQVSAPASGRA